MASLTYTGMQLYVMEYGNTVCNDTQWAQGMDLLSE